MSIRTTNFDALAAAAPLDRQASVVRDGSGEAWDPKLHTPPPRFDAPPLPIGKLPASKSDLAGTTFGCMTVIRYHGRLDNGSRWLCRCVCGIYELRRTRSVTKPQRPDHACASCERLKHLQWANSKAADRARRAEDAAMLDRLAEGSR